MLQKTELYQIIKRHKPPKNYIIGNIFNARGFKVFRLSPYNCNLNLIEYIWDLIKCRVAHKKVMRLEGQIESITLEAIASITSDVWKK